MFTLLAQAVSPTVYPVNPDMVMYGTNLLNSLVSAGYSLIGTVVSIAWPWVIAITVFYALLRFGRKHIHI